MHLPKAGAALVDGRLAATAHKVGVAHTEKLCQEALDHYDPTQAEERRIAAAENRRVDVHLSDAGRDGTVDIVGTTDTADAIDLETALAQAAAPTRRRRIHRLAGRPPLTSGRGDRPPLPRYRARPDGQTPTGHHQRPPPRPGHRPLRHHPSTHLRGAGQRLVHPPRHPSRSSARSRTSTSTSGSTQYEVPDRLDQQVTERDGTCIHPWCTRPARRCDKDHCQPYDRGGTTCSCNIAPLCRRHHRAKTHAGWTYRFLRPGAYLWRSPAGYWFHRDRTGTTDLGRLKPTD